MMNHLSHIGKHVLEGQRTVLHLRTSFGRHDTRTLKEARSAIRAGLVDRAVLVGHAPGASDEAAGSGQGIELMRLALRTKQWPRSLPFQAVKGCELMVRTFGLARQLRPTLIHAHSLHSLPAGLILRTFLGVPLVYDAHELETERNGLRGARQMAERAMERCLIRAADAVLCVSDSIADWYAEAYRISRPFVVRNIPDLRWQQSRERSNILRDSVGLGSEPIVFLYQGALASGRRIEQLLRVFIGAAPGRHLVLMGYGPLEGLVRAAALKYSNIHFQPAVPPEDVLMYTAGADVGICGGENVCLSYYYSLPNKLFEYLMAGLPILVPDWPEMKRIAEGQGCGWVVGETDAAWIAQVNGVTRAAINAARENVRATAAMYTWGREERVLMGAYRHALDARAR